MDKILSDLIVSWPRHTDYPLWRQQIHDNRDLFAKVIVVFTDMNVQKDYREWIKMVMKDDDISFVDSDPVASPDDWRNIAVNTGLKYSDSEWVFFTEQDFFWREGFWDAVKVYMADADVVSVDVDGRMHPCCIFIKRKLLNEHTRKDFGVVPNMSDHFSKIQEDLQDQPKEWMPAGLYTHMSGLSQNMFLLTCRKFFGKDPREVMTYPKEFKKYCEDCLKVVVPMHRDFEEMFNEYIRRSTS